MTPPKRDTNHTQNQGTITNPFGDIYIKEYVGEIFETTRAADVFSKRFKSAIFHEDTLYVIVGTDSGLLPKHIIQHGLPRGSRYLFVEAGAIIDHLDKTLIPPALSDRIIITNVDNWPEQARELALANYAYTGKISYAKSCAVQQSIYPDYPMLSQAVAQELRHIFWLFNSQFDERVFINTQLSNIAENRLPAIVLKDSFKGKTAIVLAAGPSLDDLIPWIKTHRDEAIIISVSRISTRLLQAGLEPDMVVSVDPQFISFSVSKDMLKFKGTTLFVQSSSASPLLIGHWPHQSVFSGPRIPWIEEDFDNIVTIAPTVTNNAILLAIELGCKQIILAGVDLCYNAEGYTHVSGTKEHAAGPMIGHIDHTVETNSGETAETNKGYYEAITTIERQAAAAMERDCRFINPSPGAARMKNVEHIKIENLSIDAPLEEAAWETISSRLEEDNSENRKRHYEKMLQLLEKSTKTLENIKCLANQALQYNISMMNSINTPAYSGYKIKMDDIERKLDGEFEDMSNSIKRYNAAEFAKIISADDENEWTSEEVFNKTRHYYEAYENGAEALSKQIEVAKTRLKNRLEEEKQQPDFESMTGQWRQDLQLGRANLWKLRHNDIYTTIASGIREKLESLSSQYKAMLNADDENLTLHFQNLATDANIIGSIVENAKARFDKGDHNGLQRIADGLNKRTEPLASQAHLLIKGLIKELEQDHKAAEELYHQIDELISKELKQIGLERILNYSMTLRDYPTALSALKTLSQDIVSYLPFYARLLALTGSTIEAIGVSLKYLEQHPRDLDMAAMLGMLFIDTGAYQAAQGVLDHIRGADQNHPGIDQISIALMEKHSD